MKRAKVSVILPTYNRAQSLGAAIESVLNQTYTDLELLVIDDGSTDDTAKLMSGYTDDRVIYEILGENQGVSAARNYGLKHATGDYIAFEDSDDIWYPDKLAKQVACIQDACSETGFVYHKIRYRMGGQVCAILPSEEIALSKKSGDIYEQMLYDNLIPCPSILATRSCIERAGEFDIELRALEDYDYALKMTKYSQGIFIDEILLDAGYSTDGVSGNPVNYLLASCSLVGRYRQDYLQTETLNHRLEIILRDAQRIGMQEQFVRVLEQQLRS